MLIKFKGSKPQDKEILSVQLIFKDAENWSFLANIDHFKTDIKVTYVSNGRDDISLH